MKDEPAGFANVYRDETRARAYADLGFPATYHLAFRDLPPLIRAHARGTEALDFGCGAGRSTRFLRRLGFHVTGVDISPAMLGRARKRDPGGHYVLVLDDGRLGALKKKTFDLVLSALTFDNIPGRRKRRSVLEAVRRVLKKGGVFVNLVSAPELYRNEWVSLSPGAFPENREAREGETVRIVILDGEDQRPVQDILWTDEGYRRLYREAGLELLETHRPLGDASEPYDWVSETKVPPWTIYVLGRGHASGMSSSAQELPGVSPC